MDLRLSENRFSALISTMFWIKFGKALLQHDPFLI